MPIAAVRPQAKIAMIPMLFARFLLRLLGSGLEADVGSTDGINS